MKTEPFANRFVFLHEKYQETYAFGFANGGDQNNNSIPEVPVCQELGIELIDGLGAKIQSSSWLLGKNNVVLAF